MNFKKPVGERVEGFRRLLLVVFLGSKEYFKRYVEPFH